MQNVLFYALVLFALIVFWRWVRARFSKLFIIELANGRAVVRRGEPPASFVEECGLILRLQPVRGFITGHKLPRGVALRFSSTIDDDLAQQFRNVFPFDLYDKPGGPGTVGKRRA